LKNDRIVFKNKKVLSKYLKGVEVSFNNQNEVCFNGACISKDIRSKAVTEMVSYISALDLVRKKMVLSQRKIAKNRDCILDGRDIGSVVFPNAEYKFFFRCKHRRSCQEKIKRI
jgi:cytidylate kinase